LKRSNRLVLLIGIFLAVVAFVLILFTLGSPGTGENKPATTIDVVVATKDIPLGAKIAATDVTTKTIPIGEKPANGFTDTSFVIGQNARQSVSAGQLLTTDILNPSSQLTNVEVPAGYVGVPLLVDQVTGVGTLIRAGDRVDLVMGLTGTDKVPLVKNLTNQPTGSQKPGATPLPGELAAEDLPYNSTTVKTMIEGIQVLGTLLPPPPTDQNGNATTGGSTSLNTGQQEIVIVAATAQQAEVIKFAQMQGDVSLVLRATADCQSATGEATPCPIIPTTGITLRVLVDDYGVLPPQVVQVIQPSPLPNVLPSGHPATLPSPSPSPGASTTP
jgi:Flp pilus assembly protein CpaB